MQTAQYWIDHLNPIAHPEGGFYRETYRAAETIPPEALPDRFAGARNFSTSIYFLLRAGDRSVFHRIKSDELWHYHAGDSLAIYILDEKGLAVRRLGPAVDAGEFLQIAIPTGTWFGARVIQPGSYTLAGCTVAPGFDFSDFEIADRAHLLARYPDHHELIAGLT